MRRYIGEEEDKERAGAYEVADLICEALDKLPKNEQDVRIEKISGIEVIDRRSSPKHVSTPSTNRRSRRGAAPQHKRAHR
jgi:hypothetical protein